MSVFSDPVQLGNQHETVMIRPSYDSFTIYSREYWIDETFG